MAERSSLERTLASVMRRGVPEHVLAGCGADRALLENVAHLVQEVMPETNLTVATVEKVGEVYTLRLPCATPEMRVSLAQLREIEAYSPFRIIDICVRGGEHACVVLQVATEQRALVFSEVDIVRIKRKRA
jgi:hypothetical protein